MPPSKPFSRKTATKYALVHRPQNDPRINDADAPAQVFTEISGPSSGTRSNASTTSGKVKHRGDLEEEFGLSYRTNEGEAAEHGVFFDDSKYDYMQHMRDLGAGAGDAAWIEARPTASEKSKGKMRLEDALAAASLDDDDSRSMSSSAYGADKSSAFGGPRSVYSGAPSSAYYSGGAWNTAAAEKQRVLEQQQDVPDALRGFRPDMDPRLREVLEALEDEEYVDDEEDIFDQLTGEAGGEEMGQDEWEAQGLDFEDEEGWESDATEKPTHEQARAADVPAATLTSDDHAVDEGGEALTDAGGVPLPDPHAAPPDAEHALPDTSAAAQRPSAGGPPKPRAPRSNAAPSLAMTAASSLAGPRKKRKGALTSLTGGSMTSSVVARTEALSTLDARFDAVMDQYDQDDALGALDEEDEEIGDSASLASGMTGQSGVSRASSRWTTTTGGGRVPRLVDNAAFGSVMDEYLAGNGGGPGKKGRLMRKGGTKGFWGQQGGLEQLDEIRQGLGPARMKDGRGGKQLRA